MNVSQETITPIVSPLGAEELPASAHHEVLSSRVTLLADLPAKITIAAWVLDPLARSRWCLVFFTTARARAKKLIATRQVVLGPREYEALAITMADGRVTRADAHAFVATKKGDATARVPVLERLLDQEQRERWSETQRKRVITWEGGVRTVDTIGAKWTVGQFFAALSAEIAHVWIEAEEPRT